MQRLQRQIILGIIAIVGLYIAFLIAADSQSQMGTDGIVAALASFNWRFLPLLIGLQSLLIALRFLGWQYYLGVLGARRKISLLDSFVIYASCFTMVISPAKLAEVLKSVLLKAKTDTPIARSMPIVFAERVIDGLAVLILMVVMLWLGGESLQLGTYQGIDYLAITQGIVYGSAALISLGLVIVQIRPLAMLALAVIARLPLIKRLHDPLATLYESSREIFHPRHLLPTLLIGLGVYLSSALCFYAIFLGFGFDPSWTLLLQATFITGVSAAVGAVSLVPNGAGVTETSNTLLLMAMMAPDHPMMTLGLAAALALLQGFFHKWYRVLVGLVVALIFRHRLISRQEVVCILEEAQAEAQHAPRVAPQG